MMKKAAIVVGILTSTMSHASEALELGNKEFKFSKYEDGTSITFDASLEARKIVEKDGKITVRGPKVVVDGKKYFLRGSNNNKDVIDFFCNAAKPGFVAESYTAIGLIEAGILAGLGQEVNQQVVGSVNEEDGSLNAYTLTTPITDGIKAFTCAESRQTVYF